MMNWKQNKIIFNYIIKHDYLIKKDIETTNTIFIKWDQFEMKCNYFLAFSVGDNNDICWSTDNPFIDQKTRYLSYQIKSSLGDKKKFSLDVLNNLKKIIQTNITITYENEKVNFIWCLIGSYKKYKQFYIITDIIYF